MKRNVPFNAKNRDKKEPDYHMPKKAFDSIMECYPVEAHVDLFGSDAERAADRARIQRDLRIVYEFYEAQPVKNKKGKAQGVIAAKGTPAAESPAKPNEQDFKVDVNRQISKVIKGHKDTVTFIKRYIFDIEDLSKEEQHRFAQFEQRIGRLFIEYKIYPRYYTVIRKDKVKQP